MYLNEQKKEWYMRDFISLIDKKDLDQEIVEHLRHINENDQIQTLYSAFFARKNESYLKICYSSTLEFPLKTCLEKIRSEYNKPGRYECSLKHFEPKDNPMYDSKFPKGMLYYDSSEFLRIKHSRIQLLSTDPRSHWDFWDSLKDQLVQKI